MGSQKYEAFPCFKSRIRIEFFLSQHIFIHLGHRPPKSSVYNAPAMSERENLGNILILRCIGSFANNSGVNGMPGEILEYDLLLPSAGPSLQKPTAPDIFVCQPSLQYKY